MRRFNLKTKLQEWMEQNVDWKESNEFVFMFHSVCEKNDWYNRNYCISPEMFEKLIIELKNKEYIFDSIEKLNEIKDKRKRVYFTFDDGFKSVYEYAIPIMNKYEIPYSIFITIRFVGKEGYMNWKELKEISNHKLCILGAHSYDHKCSSCCNIKELKKELCDSRAILEYKLRKKINYFAFPYGDLSAISCKSIMLAKLAGYKKIFSTISRPADGDRSMLISRININEFVWKRVLGKMR